MSRRLAISGLTLSVLLGACQTLAGSTTATIDMTDPHTRATVIYVLAEAVHRAHIELGPDNGAETSVLTVLPPPLGPYETNSPSLPIRFDIERRDGECVAVRHDTDVVFVLPDVRCHG